MRCDNKNKNGNGNEMELSEIFEFKGGGVIIIELYI
jgi:hypothetical protein